MMTRNANASDTALRESRTTPAARRNPAPSRRRTADAKEMRQQRCRLGSALAGEPKASPEAPAAPMTQEQPGDEIVPGPTLRPPVPGSTSRLFGATLAILVALVFAVLLLNRLPWHSVAGVPPTAIESAGPPASLGRGTPHRAGGAQ